MRKKNERLKPRPSESHTTLMPSLATVLHGSCLAAAQIYYKNVKWPLCPPWPLYPSFPYILQGRLKYSTSLLVFIFTRYHRRRKKLRDNPWLRTYGAARVNGRTLYLSHWATGLARIRARTAEIEGKNPDASTHHYTSTVYH